MMTTTTIDLAGQVARREWYHTLTLAPGVVTPGWFDTRSVATRLPFPRSTAGLRCLDVGTFDGFWAFEMERRGAEEVIAIDLLDEREFDWPFVSRPVDIEAAARRKDQGVGFDMAHEALASKVERRECSVYDLDPDEIGTFDLVYVGSLLLHLRDPVRALERIREVCRGKLLSVDAISVPLTLARPTTPVAALDGIGRPYWWKPNLASLRRMVEVAGFRTLQGPTPFLMPPGKGYPRPPLRPQFLRTRAGRETLVTSRIGDPHAWLLAEPTPRGSR